MGTTICDHGHFYALMISWKALAEIVKSLLEQFKLQTKVIVYVKNEGSNLKTLEKTLSANISCDVLGLHDPYVSVCFGYVMNKAVQYATIEDKVCMKMNEVNLKDAQAVLQKTITWTKKSTKRKHEWNVVCIEAGLPIRRLKTPVKTMFASKVVFFYPRNP